MSKDWPNVPLGEVLVRSDDSVDLLPTEQYKEVTIRLWGKGVVLRGIVAGSEIAAARRILVRAGQFIFSRIDARNGALGLVPDDLNGAVVSSDFPAYNLVEARLNRGFMNWLSRTAQFVDLCRAASEGTTNRVRLQEDRFLAMSISLPPLSEQRRIVAKIEQLASKIEEARGLRGKAKAEATHLVTRVGGDLFREGEFPTLTIESLLREKSRNGLSLKPSDTPPGVPILRISAGTSRPDGLVDEQDYRYIEVTDAQQQEYALEAGDLLACRFNGNLHYVGRFSLFGGRSGEVRLHPDKLIRFRVETSRVLPEYVRSVMNSPYGRKRIEAFCQTTAGNIGISASNLNTIPIPLPPLPEQRRIVAYLDDIQTKVDQLKSLQAQTAAELDALLPSILDRAFRGEF